MPIASGWIGIQTGPYAPFFQQEEMRLLRDLGALADLALQRAELFERERMNQAQFADAQRLAHVGSFQLDLRDDVVTWSDELCRIYGVDPGRGPATFAEFVVLVHPDDRDAVGAVVGAALQQCSTFEMEERILRPDGEVRVLASRGEVLAGDDGKPLRSSACARTSPSASRPSRPSRRRRRSSGLHGTRRWRAPGSSLSSWPT